jgi:hypothetical protein
MADTQPKPLTEVTGAGAGAGTVTAPSMAPPPQATARARAATGAAGAGGLAGTTWNSNQTVNALWSINQDRNSWFGAAGVGWQKLSTASDSGVVSLTALAAHGYQTQHVISYRTEADNMVRAEFE